MIEFLKKHHIIHDWELLKKDILTESMLEGFENRYETFRMCKTCEKVQMVVRNNLNGEWVNLSAKRSNIVKEAYGIIDPIVDTERLSEVKPLPCLCGHKGVCVCDAGPVDQSWWRVHCQECDWSYGGSSLCLDMNETIRAWNSIPRPINQKDINDIFSKTGISKNVINQILNAIKNMDSITIKNQKPFDFELRGVGLEDKGGKLD